MRLPRVGPGVPRSLQRHVRLRDLARRAALPGARPAGQEAALLHPRRATASRFASELKVIRDLELQEVPICQALEFYFDEHTPFRDVKSVLPGRVPALHAGRQPPAPPALVALPGVRADHRRRAVGGRRVARPAAGRLRDPQGRRRAGDDLPLRRRRLLAHPGDREVRGQLHGAVLRVREHHQRARVRRRVRRASLGFEPRIVTPDARGVPRDLLGPGALHRVPGRQLQRLPAVLPVAPGAARRLRRRALRRGRRRAVHRLLTATSCCCARPSAIDARLRAARTARSAGATSAPTSSASAAWRAARGWPACRCCSTSSRRSGATSARLAQNLSLLESRRLPAAAAGHGRSAGDGQLARGAQPVPRLPHRRVLGQAVRPPALPRRPGQVAAARRRCAAWSATTSASRAGASSTACRRR